MPTYEYVCNDCHKEFEEFQSITAPPLQTCPFCGGSVTRKISAGSGLVFKGSGFYITDYKNNNGNGKKETSTKKTAESKTKK
ncbi:MAG TPA: zinc ribbon domain-containing protein [Caldithrix abyssi]|uniref:Zinc ribbon domain-containing protein n=1 Tax=Caldithrix abyssi TaxID=187145 RepID=A0A7V4WW60_CALAY|nr:zinc ribbon domain-containing protein [Caldithrix abyssi]